MAPTTRSRTRKNANPSGLRDLASDSPNLSSDLTTLVVAPNQRITKKRKREASKQSARPKKRGRLQALPNMPIDILIEIFSVLDIRSLVCISRTTKAFRNLVLSPDFASCWKTSFDIAGDEDEIPPCPKDAQLIPWIMLVLSGPYCHICGKPCQRKISFALRMRICIKCMRDREQMRAVQYEHFSCGRGLENASVCEILPATPDPSHFKDGTYYVRRKQFEKIQQAANAAYYEHSEYPARSAAYSACLYKFRDDYRERYKHALLCEEWQDRVEAKEEEKRESIRKARKKDIASRLLSLGYTEQDMSSSGIWKVKNVIVARPLREDAWEPLFVKIRADIEPARSARLQSEYSKRHVQRRFAAQAAFFDFLMSGTVPREDFERIPHSNDYSQLEPIARFLEADVPMMDEWHVKLRATFDHTRHCARQNRGTQV